MNNYRAGVIAGTFIDTQMGVDFLMSKGVNSLGFPISSCPQEQSKLQILSPLELTNIVKDTIRKIKDRRIEIIIVYCNSLSAAVDMDKLAKEEKVIIITPHTIYKELAPSYQKIGVLAANNQSTAGIEKIIQSINSNCQVIGLGILPLVIDIEKGISARQIVEDFSLKNILNFYSHIQVDLIILGCTHFPYLQHELNKHSTIPILDPADLIYQKIKNI